MDNINLSESSASQWGNGSTFNIVVACEDSETGARALKACDEIVSRLWRDFRFSTGLWKFDDLRKSSAAQAAAREATQADMVILSAHARQDLPEEVKTWLEQWITNKTDVRRALVALLDNQSDSGNGSSLAEKYLEEAARRGDLDFFCNRSNPISLSSRVPGRTESASPPGDFRKWGINE
jgi:hypothetical protein